LLFIVVGDATLVVSRIVIAPRLRFYLQFVVKPPGMPRYEGLFHFWALIGQLAMATFKHSFYSQLGRYTGGFSQLES